MANRNRYAMILNGNQEPYFSILVDLSLGPKGCLLHNFWIVQGGWLECYTWFKPLLNGKTQENRKL